jgi:hypothetical protein
MPAKPLQPRYVIDCSALNRYFWFKLDGANIFKTRRDIEIGHYGEEQIKKALEILETLIESGEVISHVEVRSEIRNAKSAEWTRWTLIQRKLFKSINQKQIDRLRQIAGKHSAFLAQDKKGRAKHADPWVLAEAMDRGLPIIAFDGELTKIAKEYGVETINLFELPEREKKEKATLFDTLSLPAQPTKEV